MKRKTVFFVAAAALVGIVGTLVGLTVPALYTAILVAGIGGGAVGATFAAVEMLTKSGNRQRRYVHRPKPLEP